MHRFMLRVIGPSLYVAVIVTTEKFFGVETVLYVLAGFFMRACADIAAMREKVEAQPYVEAE